MITLHGQGPSIHTIRVHHMVILKCMVEVSWEYAEMWEIAQSGDPPYHVQHVRLLKVAYNPHIFAT